MVSGKDLMLVDKGEYLISKDYSFSQEEIDKREKDLYKLNPYFIVKHRFSYSFTKE